MHTGRTSVFRKSKGKFEIDESDASIMPITLEQLKILFELEERTEDMKLGTYLYDIGKKEKGANPTEDIRDLRGDRYGFHSGQ